MLCACFPLTFSGDGEREGGREKEAAGVGDATQEREEINNYQWKITKYLNS